MKDIVIFMGPNVLSFLGFLLQYIDGKLSFRSRLKNMENQWLASNRILAKAKDRKWKVSQNVKSYIKL